MKIIAIPALALALFLSGCVTLSDASRHNLASVATQYTTMRYIDGDYERARRVYDVAASALSLVTADDVEVTLEDIEQAVRSRIDFESMAPENKFLVDMLIANIRMEAERIIKARGQDPSAAKATVSAVLEWVQRAASMYLTQPQ